MLLFECVFVRERTAPKSFGSLGYRSFFNIKNQLLPFYKHKKLRSLFFSLFQLRSEIML